MRHEGMLSIGRRRSGVIVWLVLSLIGLSGCTTKLAPQYDKVLVDGLAEASGEVSTFLASVSAGTDATNFDQRAAIYAELIGRFDALALQSSARPYPKNDVIEAIHGLVQGRAETREEGVPQPTDTPDAPTVTNTTKAPSTASLTAISTTLTQMRDIDKEEGIPLQWVPLYRNSIVTYLDQALTYENFLKR